MEQLNPFDDPQQDCLVLVNRRRQYSLWPTFNEVPAGWRPVFGPQPQPVCLAWLEENWCDIRPLTPNDAKNNHV
ncbi:MbtH family protein [Sodalis sp. RH21]|uniref:MbtH family protein n=1 Tax=unclassified Sodalis (in: enterobacteria) TaxID=2636512 RepID=UPI0039B39690